MSPVLLGAGSLAVAVAGLIYGVRARQRPHLFWTYLIIGLVLTTPLFIGGYTWFDEIYAGAYLATGSRVRMATRNQGDHVLFAVFLLYMVLEGFRGIAFFSGLDLVGGVWKVRWIVMFVIIAWGFTRASSFRIRNAHDRGLAYKITIAGMVLNSIYLCFGVVSLIVSGSINFTQYAQVAAGYRAGTSPLLAVFGSTGYVASVLLVLAPAAIVCISELDRARRRFAWSSIALMLVTQLLYNSRSGMLLVGAFVALFVLQAYRRPSVLRGLGFFAVLLVGGTVFQGTLNENSLVSIAEDLGRSLHLVEDPESDPLEQDLDRRIWTNSGYLALADSEWYRLLLGYGLRTSGFVVAPYVYELFLAARGSAVYVEDVSTPAFTALAVDTGLVGLVLVIALAFLAVRAVHRSTHGRRLFLAFGPIAFVLQLFVINIFDVLLLYLALMPGGLYQQLARCGRVGGCERGRCTAGSRSPALQSLR